MIMWILRKVAAVAALLLFFLFTTPCTADIISPKIRSDNRTTILFSNFEFSNTGYISVTVSSVKITSNSSQPDPSRIGFFLQSDDNPFHHHHDFKFKSNPDFYPCDNKSIPVLFTFSDLSPVPHSSFTKSYNVTHPGEYSLYFANCNNQFVSMDVRAELYNTDHDGATKDYLSVGDPHPSFYLSFFLVYLCFQKLWIYVSLKNRHCLELIHIPMSVLLVLNLLYFMGAFAYQHDVMVTGTHNVWRILFYMIWFLREVYLLAVVWLIGVQWCNWRRFLPDWVTGHLISAFIAVILLKVLSNMYFILVVESGPYDEQWVESISAFTCTDIICCLCVLINVFSSFVGFKGTDTLTMGRSYSSLKKATFRHGVFTFLVLVYVVFTRGLSSVLQDTAFYETCTLLLSIAMFYMYRPFDFDDNQDQKYAEFLV